MIQPFQETDFEYLEKTDFMASLDIRYHGDVLKDAVFSSRNDAGETNGVLYFRYHFSWNSPTQDTNCLAVCIATEDESIFGELINYAKEWAHKQTDLSKGKNAFLITWEDDSDHESIQMHLHHGFIEYNVCPCLKYDLSRDITTYPIPTNMHIEELPRTQEAFEEFIEATRIGNYGTADSINEMSFMTGGKDYKVFVLKDGDQIVSSASMWQITQERCAIENIFCTPEYRNKNLTRTIITYTLNEIKKHGYSIATLSMRGRNLKASWLYQSLGFELFYNQIELVYPFEPENYKSNV